MKIFTIKDVAAISSYFALFLALSLSSLTYARDGDNGKHSGFEYGRSEGHSNGYSNHKGHKNEPYAQYGHNSNHPGFDKGKHKGHKNEPYAQYGHNGNHPGFDKGKHKGHSNSHGKHKGHKNVRNPWYRFRFSKATSGADIELTIHHHGMSPPLIFTATYNSIMTIQEVLDDILVDPTGFYFQECFMTTDIFGQILTDCTEGENPVPLDSSLTLQNAGLVEDPEVYLLFSLN